MFKKQNGFTLIELLIVVIILGILMVIAIPQFMNNRVESQYNTCRTNVKAVAAAVARWRYDTNPTAATMGAQITTNTLTTSLVNGITVGNNTNVTYLSDMPTCPCRVTATGVHYGYEWNQNANLNNRYGIVCLSTSNAETGNVDHDNPDVAF